MQPSAELKSLILQLYEKEAASELFKFSRRLYSQQDQDGVLVIGSEPSDRHEGYQAIIHFYEKAGAAGYEISVNDLTAHFESTFGWVVDRVTVKLRGGVEIPVRHTYIFHREEHEWKIVHAHIPVGVSDESLGA